MDCKEFHPYPYQQFCIQHIIDHPAAGLFVDMGMGKTVMTLTAFNYLKYYAWQIRRCLVIAPKKVAEATWRTEISGWQHLRHLRCSEVLGTATQRRAAMAVDADIYVTGSNSKLLSGELATYLSGRYIQIQVFPFSLAEAKQQCIENGTYTSDEKLFADYLKYGGFPQRFFLPDDHSITTYLDDLYEAIIVRDIMLRHNIREQTALRNVLAFLLDNIGNPFSARNISGRMVSEGIKTTTATVLNYVDYFKEAFILLNASRYDIKGKALLSSTEKYYAVDLGLRNVIKKSEKLDSNKLYENIVYLEMRSHGYEVHVGKMDDTEIDFICYRGDEKLYIQVAYLITPADEEREFGNLERLHDNYPKYVISGDLMNLSRNGIIHRNIIDFLLNP